jgi:hypothetical protein
MGLGGERAQAGEIRVGRPHRPFGVNVINLFGRAANMLGMHPAALDEEILLERAIKKAGSSDFGGDDFREGLRRFLASAEREAKLTLLGRLMVQSYVTDNLANRLRLVDWRKRHPEIENEEITAPLFIIGLPRTGTTILHALLEQDPANRSPLFWEVQFPVPPATPDTWHDDPRIAKHQKILNQLFKLVPGFAAMHPMGATMPQECVAVFTMCFMSEQLQVQFDVPSYQAWLDEQDMHSTYEFHKRFLQHAQSGGIRGGRWVLKSPAHVHLIDTLLDVFPDARIVHTHRDPIKVCASVASLTAALRGAGQRITLATQTSRGSRRPILRREDERDGRRSDRCRSSHVRALRISAGHRCRSKNACVHEGQHSRQARLAHIRAPRFWNRPRAR